MQGIKILALNTRLILKPNNIQGFKKIQECRHFLHTNPVTFQYQLTNPIKNIVQSIPEPSKIIYRRIGWLTTCYIMTDFTYKAIKEMPHEIKVDKAKKHEYIVDRALSTCVFGLIFGRLLWPFFWSVKAAIHVMDKAS